MVNSCHSQLHHDGYSKAAKVVSEATLTPPDTDILPSQLETFVQSGMSVERDACGLHGGLSYQRSDDCYYGSSKDVQGIDLDITRDVEKHTVRTDYHTCFIATHKFSCRCASFSPDGRYSATASQDTSVKLLDVAKIKDAKINRLEEDDGNTNVRAVIRTFYGHTQSVNDLDFHPIRPLLASASRDCTIKFFDLQSSKKRSKKDIKDSHNVRSIRFHPSGDYILAGTDHAFLRLYCCSTQQCYVTREQNKYHLKAINHVDIVHGGKIFASASKDGTIKFWDGVNLKCIQTLERAHEGLEVYSVQFSKNGKYLLSGGQDGVARLWDIRTFQILSTYCQRSPTAMASNNVVNPGGLGPSLVSPSSHVIRSQSRFSYDESQVILPDPNITGAVVFDTFTREVTQKLLGHSQPLRAIATSPIDPHIITCSQDSRARFWVDEVHK